MLHVSVGEDVLRIVFGPDGATGVVSVVYGDLHLRRVAESAKDIVAVETGEGADSESNVHFLKMHVFC